MNLHLAMTLAKPCAIRVAHKPQATVYGGCSALSASMVVSAVAAGGRSICSLTLIARHGEEQYESHDNHAVGPQIVLSEHVNDCLMQCSVYLRRSRHGEQTRYGPVHRPYWLRPKTNPRIITNISPSSKTASLDHTSPVNTEQMLLPPAATAETTIEADNALQPPYTVA
jgi:hypothetical protein